MISSTSRLSSMKQFSPSCHGEQSRWSHSPGAQLAQRVSPKVMTQTATRVVALSATYLHHRHPGLHSPLYSVNPAPPPISQASPATGSPPRSRTGSHSPDCSSSSCPVVIGCRSTPGCGPSPPSTDAHYAVSTLLNVDGPVLRNCGHRNFRWLRFAVHLLVRTTRIYHRLYHVALIITRRFFRPRRWHVHCCLSRAIVKRGTRKLPVLSLDQRRL